MTLVVSEETPAGAGGVSVVRVRGERALYEVSALLGRPDLAIGVPRFVRLRIGGEDLDEALVCALSAREVELHVHGSPVLVRALLDAFAPRAARATPADAADASTRARALLSGAACESGARILLDQAEGAWLGFLAELSRAPDPRAELERARERARVAQRALEQSVVLLAGPVNAGKSTLFNVLAGERRAITSRSPGTTRDLVRARALLGRYPVELVDTAGERDAGELERIGELERAGIERARAARDRADLVVWLCAATGPGIAGPAGSLCVSTHSDLVTDARPPAISATAAPEAARATIARLFAVHFGLPQDPWTPGSACAFDAASRRELDDLSACASNADLRARAGEYAARDAARVAGRALET